MSRSTEELDGPIDGGRRDYLVAVVALAAVVLWIAWGLWLGDIVVALLAPDAGATVTGSTASALERAGQFGDMFGGINALFTALAFVAVWWTGRMQYRELRLQRQEIRLQREALELQRKELEATREEIARTASAQEKQLAHSEIASERQLRAYVNLEAATCHLDKDLRLALSVRIKNYGQTPAYSITPSAWIGVAGSIEEWSASAFPNVAVPMGVLPPGGVAITGAHGVLTPENVNRLARQVFDVFAEGEVAFDDAFGKRRTMKYRLKAGGRLSPGGTPVAMEACRDGNDAD
jgi:hypothetical protein